MKVNLIAHTNLADLFDIKDWFDAAEELGFEVDAGATDAEALIEFAGRLCYESYSKPNEATRANKDYLANVALQKHFSVFEHASVTFLFRGVSRALTHELVRHRHFSYSQVSQRYCNSSKRKFVDHPVLGTLEGENWDGGMAAVVRRYEDLVEKLVDKGYSRKEARGAARLVLPEGTTTDIVVTGNFRSWLEFIDKRATKFADAEIRELAEEVLRHLQETFPNAFQDSIVNHEENRPVPVSLAPTAVVKDEDLQAVAPDITAIIKAELARAMKEMFNR